MHRVLKLANVSHTYGSGRAAVQALRGINFVLRGGEVALLEGPSGSGKTTLLLIAGGLMHPTRGKVFLLNDEVTDRTEEELPKLRAAKLGFIFQSFNLLESLTAEENVMIAGLITGTRHVRSKARQLLERFDLLDRVHHIPKELSGGEKQRVAVARALMNDPSLILADEPTANLDTANGQLVMRLLKQIAKDEDRAVLIASHDPRVRRFVDRRIKLVDGKIV